MKSSLHMSLAGMPKYVLGFLFTLVFRLLSPYFGMWNVSPLMATELAGAKAYGPWVAGLYGVASIVILDACMGKLGSWTAVTAITYGLVGVFGAYYFKTRSATAVNFVIMSVAGAVFFDLITGVLMGPLLYGQPWMEAVVGQVPFTLRHTAGNIFFAVTLAPWFYRSIMNNPKWETASLFRFA